MLLTPEQKKTYVESDGECPYCGSVYIECESIDSEEYSTIYQCTTCRGCGKSWTDVYRIADIIEHEEKSDESQTESDK